MTSTLFSPVWHRVAERRPRLRSSIQISRQVTRGEIWHVLSDPISGQRCRLNPQAWQFVGRLDGARTVEQTWDRLAEVAGEDLPTQDEIVHLLGQLVAQGMVTMDVLPDFASRAWRRGRQAARRMRERINPLALRVPLGSPTPLLDRMAPLGRVLFSRVGWLGWILLVAGAVALALPATAELQAQVAQRMGTPWMLFLAWLVFIPAKALHELAHGLAARRFGADVPEAGVSLLVLVPSPYVDASDSTALARRGERLVVASAGIASDLALAALALLVWNEASPGVVRDLALAVFFVAGIGTVLFNANPLLRFDGYHILSEALDLPQLGSRSQRLWRQRWHRLAGLESESDLPAANSGERAWLELHAPLAFLCRLLLAAGIAVWIGSFSSVLGAAVAVGSLVGLVLVPAWTLVRDLLRNSQGTPWHARVRWRTTTGLVALSALLIAVPLPEYTTAHAVVQPGEGRTLRPEVDGLVMQVHQADGSAVVPGDLILTLDDPALRARHERVLARIAELEAERYGQLGRDPLRASDGEEALRRALTERDDLATRLERLEIRATVAGSLALPQAHDLAGRWAHRGEAIGYILDRSPLKLRAAVPETAAALLRNRLYGAEARFADDPIRRHPAEMVRDMPAAVRELPAAALGVRGAGSLETDPLDERGLRTADPYVHIEVRVAAPTTVRVEGRAWVRFDHGWSTLAAQGLRALRQVFLRRFESGT